MSVYYAILICTTGFQIVVVSWWGKFSIKTWKNFKFSFITFTDQRSCQGNSCVLLLRCCCFYSVLVHDGGRPNNKGKREINKCNLWVQVV
jgi:hypothetical protein